MISTAKIPAAVYAENTPNPSAMKFVADRRLIDGPSVEYTQVGQTKDSPLATMIFQFPFVKSVFIAGNFVTVTKIDSVNWNEVVTEMRELIRDFVCENPLVVHETGKAEIELTTEADKKIVGILDEYIKPAIEQDGGAINFKSFNKGVVTVQLRGACSGCPSSKYTLKMGIEGVLKKLMPEVKEVVAEEL